MSFFENETHPNSDATKMSLGECCNHIKDELLKVPDYQRAYVWSSKQQANYLESLSKNMPLFGPVINIDTRTGDQWIMDGQNRIMTIYRFLSDEIKYKDIYFSELPDHEKRKIKNMKMSYTETRDWTRNQCQDFFMRIQEGVKLKYGELIHAKPENELTRGIVHILQYYGDYLERKAKDGGLGFTASMILRYGHYEIIGTLIHMVRETKYPLRPGKTALKEFVRWEDENTPTPSQREIAITEVKELLHKYSKITENVSRLKQGVKKEEHLRLMYFIFKNQIFKEELNEDVYNRIDNLLNRTLNKDNPEYEQIILWGTGGVEQIYDLYLQIYNE